MIPVKGKLECEGRIVVLPAFPFFAVDELGAHVGCFRNFKFGGEVSELKVVGRMDG